MEKFQPSGALITEDGAVDCANKPGKGLWVKLYGQWLAVLVHAPTAVLPYLRSGKRMYAAVSTLARPLLVQYPGEHGHGHRRRQAYSE